MKKQLIFILTVLVTLTACSAFRIGPNGEGEYVIAESLVPYDENNLRQMKKDGILAAQKAAVEKVAGVFISSATTVDQAQIVEDYGQSVYDGLDAEIIKLIGAIQTQPCG